MAEEFILDWKVDQPAVLAGKSEDLYALVTIKPNISKLGALLESSAETTLPAHLIVVVDVSGSMQLLIQDDPHARVVGSGTSEGQSVSYVESEVPSRLTVARRVVEKLVQRLSPADRMTLVAFDHQAYPLATCVSASQRRDLERAVEQLGEIGGGGTSMGRGFQAVLKALGSEQRNGTTRKLVVLTDGEDQEQDLALEQAHVIGAQHHIPIHGFGTGECRVDFLTEISKTTMGGSFQHIQSETDAEQFFDEVLTSQKNILATNVALSLWLSPEMYVQELYRTKPEILYVGTMRPDANNTLGVPIEYMEKGRTYEFLFHCTVPAREAGRRFRLAKACLNYDLPALNLAGQKVEANIVIEYTNDAEQAMVRVGDVRRVVAHAEVQRQVLFLQQKIDALKSGAGTDKDRTTVARLLDTLIGDNYSFPSATIKFSADDN